MTRLPVSLLPALLLGEAGGTGPEETGESAAVRAGEEADVAHGWEVLRRLGNYS